MINNRIGGTSWNSTTNTAEVRIDRKFLHIQTAIYGAGTFFHEAYHANLLQHAVSTFGTIIISSWPKSINDMTLKELSAYVDATSAGSGPWVLATHEFMANNIELMALGLRNYVQINHPNTYAQIGDDMENYRSLALMGLEETKYWDTEVKNKNKEQEYVAKAQSFITSELFNCSN